jgi:hypothetical protein
VSGATCFVSFVTESGQFQAQLHMLSVTALTDDLSHTAKRAAAIYSRRVSKMRHLIQAAEKRKLARKPVLARQMWLLGEEVIQCVSELAKLNLQLDGLYEHLTLHLGVKRMWLEKVIIFRTHLQDIKHLPHGYPWGLCRDSPKKAALALLSTAKIGKEVS